MGKRRLLDTGLALVTLRTRHENFFIRTMSLHFFSLVFNFCMGRGTGSLGASAFVPQLVQQ